MAKLEGYPLRSVMNMSMGAMSGQSMSGQSTSEVIDVREQAPPTDVRAVPEGFTQQASPLPPPK